DWRWQAAQRRGVQALPAGFFKGSEYLKHLPLLSTQAAGREQAAVAVTVYPDACSLQLLSALPVTLLLVDAIFGIEMQTADLPCTAKLRQPLWQLLPQVALGNDERHV